MTVGSIYFRLWTRMLWTVIRSEMKLIFECLNVSVLELLVGGANSPLALLLDDLLESHSAVFVVSPS